MPQTEVQASAKSEDLPQVTGAVADAHRALYAKHRAKVDALDAKSAGLSLARLLFFLAMVIVGSAGFSQNSWPLLLGGVALLVGFGALVIVHAKAEAAKQQMHSRAEVHRRHLLRLAGRFTELPPAGVVAPGHPYAFDLDLVGKNSLCQRIDVSHTIIGEQMLSAWLGAPATPETIHARQEAVAELAEDLEFRETLEAAGARVDGGERLDPRSFLAFTQRKDLVRGKPVALVIFVLPLVTLGVIVASQLVAIPSAAWMGALGLQAVVAYGLGARVIDAFQLVAARRGYVESLKGMLVAVEKKEFDAPLLKSLQERVRAGGRPPSQYMARLDRWAGFAEFYTQFPVHFFVNILVLWDLHVLLRLERFNADVGQGLEDAFDALGELEALASLATLQHGDPSASLPDIHAEPVAFSAEGIAHPLLPVDARVPNDVHLPQIGSALLITGSNMAGKSTLLRAVGLNIALAFAGGPVIASKMRVSPLRLRASMRVDDSLQQGASYFHAELAKLNSVVGGADQSPPIFFLLDELLRGTNARARHLGARAVLEHLLDRGASGLSATHDVALARMEDEQPERIHNVHFTDVMRDDEMVFDYRLREGVVRTSNALRLLQMVGIDVKVDDKLPEGIG